MKYFDTPQSLHDVFGERQSIIEMACTILFAVIGTFIVYSTMGIEFNHWKPVLAFVVIADILAGCIANFSFGTNQYYATRAKHRLGFIAIHFHIVLVAWLLAEPLLYAFIVWGYTIIAASIVNLLKGKSIQTFIAANFMCYGLFMLLLLPISKWFLLVSVFFMIKVLFSFAVDHFANPKPEQVEH